MPRWYGVLRIDGRTRLYGVMGDPVEHTLSPAMHNAAFAALGMNAVYLPLPVEPQQLRRALLALPALGFGGVNLTVPHKERALRVVHQATERARRIGAVNTVVVRRGRLLGDNTDGEGLLRALREGGVVVRGASAVVLGAGGAARAVAVTLAAAGCHSLTISNRTVERARRLAAWVRRAVRGAPVDCVALGSVALADRISHADLVVNATSVGLRGETVRLVPSAALQRGQHVVDLVYRPSGTALLVAARRRGAHAHDGLGMLLHQGAFAFELWTGRRAPLDVMRRALQKAVTGDKDPAHLLVAAAGSVPKGD